MSTQALAKYSLTCLSVLVLSTVVWAHCDTLNGPVVSDARVALDRGEVTPVLKWVKPAAEAEIKAAFTQALAVRKLGPAAQELADRYFFETLVRVHRAGEGAPYTGLKGPETVVDPGIEAADQALEAGQADELLHHLTTALNAQLGRRFQQTVTARQHANDSVAAGRTYVAAYVDYIHYVERLHQALTTAVAHAEPETQSEHAH